MSSPSSLSPSAHSSWSTIAAGTPADVSLSLIAVVSILYFEGLKCIHNIELLYKVKQEHWKSEQSIVKYNLP